MIFCPCTTFRVQTQRCMPSKTYMRSHVPVPTDEIAVDSARFRMDREASLQKIRLRVEKMKAKAAKQDDEGEFAKPLPYPEIPEGDSDDSDSSISD